jgi:hypothetical protein
MSCEFLGVEFNRSKKGVTHQRDYCTLNDLGCLVDDPLGYVNCTRRTFVLMKSGHTPAPLQKHWPRKGPDISQMALL